MIFHSIFNKPILIVGNGVRAADAHSLLLQFMEKTDIPVLTSMNAVDLVQNEHKLGFIGTHGNRIANMIVQEADLVIAVGVRLGLRQVGKQVENFAPKAKLIRADIDEYELARSVKENEEKYLIDAKDFFLRLLDEEIPKYTGWKQKCFEAKALLDPFDKEAGNLAIEKIVSYLPDNPIISVDVGQHQCWSAQSLKLKGNEGRIFIGGGYGCMGCGLPWAIGASISQRSNKLNDVVYCIVGDGGLQMNIQEFETIVREKLPIKIFVMNNRVLGKIWETQHFSHGNRFAETAESGGYTVPAFEKIANAYGIKAEKIDSYEALENYSSWIKDDEPCLFNIMLPDESLLVPKIDFDTGIMKPTLNDSLVCKVKSLLQA